MSDEELLALFRKRDEAAIAETKRTYGGYCMKIAGNILNNSEDAEECVSDALFRLWNAVPPGEPACLRQYLGAITRRLACSRWKAAAAEKRGGGVLPLVLDELGECAAGTAEDPEAKLMLRELGEAVSRFAAALPERERKLLIRRYYYVESVGDIAERYGLRPGNVSVILSRVRRKLRDYLKKEGYLS